MIRRKRRRGRKKMKDQHLFGTTMAQEGEGMMHRGWMGRMDRWKDMTLTRIGYVLLIV
jgi:hypothetical protein